MSADERLVRAHDLAISAFLADTIYNFGELVRRARSIMTIRNETDVCGNLYS
jgi:hypothetical protein